MTFYLELYHLASKAPGKSMDARLHAKRHLLGFPIVLCSGSCKCHERKYGDWERIPMYDEQEAAASLMSTFMASVRQ